MYYNTLFALIDFIKKITINIKYQNITKTQIQTMMTNLLNNRSPFTKKKPMKTKTKFKASPKHTIKWSKKPQKKMVR